MGAPLKNDGHLHGDRHFIVNLKNSFMYFLSFIYNLFLLTTLFSLISFLYLCFLLSSLCSLFFS